MLHTGWEIYMNNGAVSAMVDVVLFFASAILTLTKHVFLHIHQDKITENMKLYLKDWSNTEDLEFLKVMRSHVKVNNSE